MGNIGNDQEPCGLLLFPVQIAIVNIGNITANLFPLFPTRENA